MAAKTNLGGQFLWSIK